MSDDMRQSDNAAPTTWQGYLDQFKAIASTAGLVTYTQALEELGGIEPSMSAFLPYRFGLHSYLAKAYLLAVVQHPAGQAESAFDEISRAARGMQFDRRAPRALSRDWRDQYGDVKASLTNYVQVASDVLAAMVRQYADGTADVSRDADSLLREACELSLSQPQSVYKHLVAEAGALMLLGSPIWTGWLNEGSPQFSDCAIALDATALSFKAVIPLAPIDVQRTRADELAASLADADPFEISTDLEPSADDVDWTSDAAVMALARAAVRKTPLTDAEVAAMGEVRERLIDSAMMTLVRSATAPLDLVDAVQNVAIRALGRLRADDPTIISQIVMHLAHAGFESSVIDAGIDALADIGAPAIGPCLAFVRNSLNDDGRLNVAHALGVVGRGDDAVYQVLADGFRAAEYDTSSWALALAATHDQRAVAPIAQAFIAVLAEDEDPDVIYMDAMDYLDALHELGVLAEPGDAPSPAGEGRAAWRSVEVRGVGTLANAVPPDWVSPDQRPADVDDDDEDDEIDWFRSMNAADVDEDGEVDWFGSISADDGEYDDVIDRPEGMTADDANRYFGEDFTASASLDEFAPPEPPVLPYIAENKVGRNDPCPCGSGKKYKHCHGKAA